MTERTAELAEANRSLETEIVDRTQAEQWLLESEQRFRGYFEQGLVGMAILTAGRDWVEVNARLCKMLGYSEEELLLAGLAGPDVSRGSAGRGSGVPAAVGRTRPRIRHRHAAGAQGRPGFSRRPVGPVPAEAGRDGGLHSGPGAGHDPSPSGINRPGIDQAGRMTS